MADRERRNLVFAHQEWLGFVQPVGLVVAPDVLVDAQVIPDRNIATRQRELQELLQTDKDGGCVRWRAPDLRRVFVDWLGWDDNDLESAASHREELEIYLPELQVALSPTWAVPIDPGDQDADSEWVMLIQVEDDGADLDRPPDGSDGWNANRHARFERLLRETGVSTGLLCSDERIRLIYAPKGESSGHITFEFAQMALPAGRPILAAFYMLLSAEALFDGGIESRLPILMARSRDAQAEVSARLSRQVLGALHELLRGFVKADPHDTATIADLARCDPDHLYGGLVTTLMRLVFALYAEDRGLMPDHPVYQQHYSLGGLFARLRADAAAWPDTMDQRFGAWTQLLALFRLIHGGGGHGGFSFVARRGALFDSDRFPFLEGCGSAPSVPMIPDATVWNVLRSLMMLDGERLSYRTLDVEQIGSVYEAVMGFRVELTTGRSISVASPKRTGAAVIVDLDKLLDLEGDRRTKTLQDQTTRKVIGAAAIALREADTIEGIAAALDRVIDRDATPDIVAAHTPVLQPTDERRRSGSHYTPRSLTEPIVSEALRPVFERLDPDALPEDILDLKVLDPATGSGAFLVEVCRQLSARLVEAWSRHDSLPELPDDEDELLHARRLVARKCLYGVDRNPMAIDLARLSLWLVTLAHDHEFTFIDHALRHGDALVGLTSRQIEGFHWDAEAPNFQFGTETPEVRRAVSKVSELRELIRQLGDDVPEHELRELLDDAEDELWNVRSVADLVLAAFFGGTKPKERENRRKRYADMVFRKGLAEAVRDVAVEARPLVATFHWEIEFPEVFDRNNPGFDAVVGNPPFAGKNTIATANPLAYPDWLKQIHSESHGNADLVAHFFRRAFGLLRDGGTLGLIATNTIGQGDTRSTGLRWICKRGGEIYRAQRRFKWPGDAAVVVSVIHIHNGQYKGPRHLDGKDVEKVTAFLFHGGSHDDPERLKANAGKSFQGSIVLGMGFTFDDTDNKGTATPLAERQRLIKENPCNRRVILPYIGGQEINTSPAHAHHRHVIYFRDWPLQRADLGETWQDASEEARRDWRRAGIVPSDYPEPVAADWPELLAIVEEKVKPERVALPPKNSWNRDVAHRWWQFGADRRNLARAINGLDRVLVVPQTSNVQAFAFSPTNMVYGHTLIIFPISNLSGFAVLQSRFHQLWSAFLGPTMKDDLRYTPSDCFETFPFPENWETHPSLEAAGEAYYEFRAALMIKNGEGLTKTYNRFHDPEELDPRVAELRWLHTAMDRAVLDAYGWDDIPTDCEFLLDYEIDEETWGKKKKPWRYRWPEAIRNEVLARLLALNAERARSERKRSALSIQSAGSPSDGK